MQISVIIPTYNRQTQLEECLMALHKTHAQNIEVIIIDDGSSIEIKIDPIHYPFPLKVISQPNFGPAAAKNKGAHNAQGELLLFLDDDCLVFSDFFIECEKLFQSNKTLQACGVNLFSSPAKNIYETLANESNSENKEQCPLLQTRLISHSGFVIRKDKFIEIGGFDPSLSSCEDEDLTLKLQQYEQEIVYSPLLKMIHHKKIKNLKQWLEKADWYYNKDEDIIIKKYPLYQNQYFGDRLFINARRKFLLNKKILNLIYFYLFLALHSVGVLYRKTYKHRNKKNFFKRISLEFLWNIKIHLNLIKRYSSIYILTILNESRWVQILKHFIVHNFKTKNRPKEFILFITNRCQANCDHCFYFEHLNNKNKDLTLLDYFNISKELKKIERLYVSGGEPFLRKDLPEIIHIFYKKNKLKTVFIPTNGYREDVILTALKETIRRCPDLKIHISVSLDGFQETHDHIRKLKNSFLNAKDTLEKLIQLKKQNNNLVIGVCSSLMPKNKKEYLLFKKHIEQSYPELDLFSSNIVYPREENGLSKNRIQNLHLNDSEWLKFIKEFSLPVKNIKNKSISKLESFRTQLRKMTLYYIARETEKTKKQIIPCKAAQFYTVIRENGDVSYCEETPPIGNIRNQNLTQILNSKTAKNRSCAIKKGECACSHYIFNSISLKVHPFKIKTLIAYWNGLKLLKKMQ